MTGVIEVPQSPAQNWCVGWCTGGNTSSSLQGEGDMQPPCAHEDTGLQLQPLLEGQNHGAPAADGAPCPAVSVPRNSPAKRVLVMLCFGNLLNSMDWFLVPGNEQSTLLPQSVSASVAGILLDIQKYFGLSDEKIGLLQTVFTVCYMLAAPIFGYLGDRYNRKILLGAGILLWSGVTLGSSFITESYYWIFVLSRGLVGIGTASYSTIAPTIIADLFEEGKRTTVLSLFYIFIPVGSGCGYVLAAGMASSTGDWHWAFRGTPLAAQVADSCLVLVGGGETVQQPGQVLMFLLAEDTFGMGVTALRPPQTEESEVLWKHFVTSSYLVCKMKRHKQVSGAECLLQHPCDAVQITPCMGGLALVLLLLLVPHRTQRRTPRYRALSISGTTQGADETPDVHRTAETTWCQDVGSLAKNCSFVWSSLGVAAMTFVTGALGMWVPLFLYRAQLVQGIVPPCLQEPCNSSSSLIFGAITIGTGVLGIIAGARVTRRLRKIYSKADPLICATSMFISALCLYTALVVAQTNILSTFIFIALGELFLFVIWAVVTDMLLCVVSPRCRSTAIALQILLSHLLGDAGSPFLIGAVSNALQARGAPTFQSSFRSIQSSFAICAFVGAFGGAFFLLTALSFEGDRREAKRP
ncbi:hypothetical protein BTVI_84883 [Pitangus sulphuratus]|nr:hypothetical protein BTVI_84883 [Pitangus sulphuratus]